MKRNSPELAQKLRVELFKSGVLSALYSLFVARKKQAAGEGRKYLMQDLADTVGSNKSQVSRWFNGDANPNWRLSTFYELCDALDGELHIAIVDRKTGIVHTSRGETAEKEVPTFTHHHSYIVNQLNIDFDRKRLSHVHMTYTQTSTNGKKARPTLIAMEQASGGHVAAR